MSADPLWYKDAVFYELHVKSFQDGNGDGVGDFRGLTERLDYVADLGVDVIWLLPFYPSPLRDDGYDIADYGGIHPSYGTVDDFQRFMDEAHRRGLRVIADLVLNHTSDQHRWFQRARRAPKGSPERDWYVWSDTDERYPDARIIFTDTEPSNWTWDPVAGQYYWHRFFAHQPDLNWDNPAVRDAMFEVMEFWLDRGLDGFRADAVPYLIERDGTDCENLPETHDILKQFRARLDEKYPGRILLAEANQWPDDVRPYFGDGDEFQMAFHFPLMPRIFMAVRQGVRKPIVEIIERTPEIPESCQWCMFLRNHDELTLEMVTDEERDYMYREYAADPRMRINLGIRRRLAPLMENDRRKIELLDSILFTMPGSPIVYYGDEIGMGDNFYLGDRDGVRTPMQWSLDRNAGFSRADAQRLLLPVIADPVYGYQSVNVEAQQRSPFSLLNWTRRLIQVRKAHRAFGRGSIEFLRPENPHVLAYLREYRGEVLLVVNNLAGTPQPVRLDLSRFDGRVPVELLGGTDFPPIDETPYAMTLAPYGFFWFGLRPSEAERREELERRRARAREWAEHDAAILADPDRMGPLVGSIPAEWLRAQRWFGAKGREVGGVELADLAPLPTDGGQHAALATVRVRYAEAGPDLYFLPMALRPAPTEEEAPILDLPSEEGETTLYEALLGPDGASTLLEIMRDERALPTVRGGRFEGRRAAAMDREGAAEQPVRRLEGEQSNTSLRFGDRWVLKAFRRLEAGEHPDLEVTRFLVEEAGFRAVPAPGGWIEWVDAAGARTTVAGLWEWVPNRGDGWTVAQAALDRFLSAAVRNAAEPDTATGREQLRRMAGDFFPAVRALGVTVGGMHRALAEAGGGRPDFRAEPVTEEDARRWADAFRRQVDDTLGGIGGMMNAIPGAFASAGRDRLARAVRMAPEMRERADDLRLLAEAGAVRTRFHGDLHLGQVLRAAEAERAGADWVVLDFEGEPARPLEERRAKHTPLRDVAGMLRSFDYAVRVAMQRHATDDMGMRLRLERWTEAWERRVRDLFLEGWREGVGDAPVAPDEPEALRRVLAVLELEKAVYELGYEVNNRPDWTWVPVKGILAILGAEDA